MKKRDNREYYKLLREKWLLAKDLADNDETAKALYTEVGSEFSYYGFYFVLQQMRSQEMEGLPYIDAKTYKGWHEMGFQVKKGEKSTLQGLTWLKSYRKPDPHLSKEENEKRYVLYPKVYHLFHTNQVEEKA